MPQVVDLRASQADSAAARAAAEAAERAAAAARAEHARTQVPARLLSLEPLYQNLLGPRRKVGRPGV